MQPNPKSRAESAKTSPPSGANGQPAASSNGPVHGGGEKHSIEMDLPHVSGGGVVAIVVVLAVLFGGLFLLGWLPHSRRMAEARAEAAEVAEVKPVVDVAKPRRASPTLDLTLPGEVQAYQATAVYARTNGYLKPLPPGIDIGAEVHVGQVIAEISAPEVDAEVEQARATLLQAQVTKGRAQNEFDFNQGTFNRYKGLASSGGVTDQQLAEKQASFNIATSSLKAAEANVKAAEASLQRLTAMQKFQQVVAPFDGVITARNYDAGALVSATTTTPGKELFRIAENDRLRVFVNVPQGYASEIQTGQPADLLVRNVRKASGVVARSAGAIDQATRTMRVEVEIENPRLYESWNLPFGAVIKPMLRPAFERVFRDRLLFPGMYSQIAFKIHRAEPPILVPTSAFMFGADGMKVAVVDNASHVHFKYVKIGRDYGSEAEVVSGLTGQEHVVNNPGERLVDGVEVKVTGAKEKAG